MPPADAPMPASSTSSKTQSPPSPGPYTWRVPSFHFSPYIITPSPPRASNSLPRRGVVRLRDLLARTLPCIRARRSLGASTSVAQSLPRALRPPSTSSRAVSARSQHTSYPSTARGSQLKSLWNTRWGKVVCPRGLDSKSSLTAFRDMSRCLWLLSRLLYLPSNLPAELFCGGLV